jgi:hypothetical protein
MFYCSKIFTTTCFEPLLPSYKTNAHKGWKYSNFLDRSTRIRFAWRYFPRFFFALKKRLEREKEKLPCCFFWGIERCGMGNWMAVAEFVDDQTALDCEEHFLSRLTDNDPLNSPRKFKKNSWLTLFF